MNLLTVVGAPVNGTDEVQRITLSGAPTGGTFKLRYGLSATAPLPFNATAAAVQAALRALSVIGPTGVTCSGGPLDVAPIDITFGGKLGRLDVPLLTVYLPVFTGGITPAVVVSVVTPGVSGTYRTSAHGQILLAGTDIYFNHGVLYAPDWQLFAPSGGGGGVVLANVVQLNPPDLEALTTVPFVLVPAAGPGTLLVPVQFCYFTDGATAYDTGGGGNVAFTYAPDSLGTATSLAIPNYLLSLTPTQFGWMSVGSVLLDRATYENQALVALQNSGPAMTGGNKTWTIITLYRVLTLP